MFSTPASLLDRLRRPDELTAWDRFAELYSPLLFHWAKKLGWQAADAADLVQDVFVILFRALPGFQYDSAKSFRAWLKTVFTNRARQRLRDRAPAAEPLDDLPGPAAELADEREYRDYLLHRAFSLIEREFSPPHTRAFREYVLAGRSVDEVAREMGISPGTVYAIKSRILNRLRQEVGPLLD